MTIFDMHTRKPKREKKKKKRLTQTPHHTWNLTFPVKMLTWKNFKPHSQSWTLPRLLFLDGSAQPPDSCLLAPTVHSGLSPSSVCSGKHSLNFKFNISQQDAVVSSKQLRFDAVLFHKQVLLFCQKLMKDKLNKRTYSSTSLPPNKLKY